MPHGVRNRERARDHGIQMEWTGLLRGRLHKLPSLALRICGLATIIESRLAVTRNR